LKDVQSFLGFINFYRRFINKYSEIVVPLTRLTRKNTPWLWSEDCQQAFDTLKSTFTSAPVLTHWDPNAPIFIESDASDYTLAAILSTQVGTEIHPIAFHSQTFSAAELNYDVHDKELLAIYEAFCKWRHYLEGTSIPVEVLTDHKNLTYFQESKLLSRRQARWSEFLSYFNMVIKFWPGHLGTKPDALTRRWDLYPKDGNSSFPEVNPQNYRPLFLVKQLLPFARATYLSTTPPRSTQTLNLKLLYQDIREAILATPELTSQMETTTPQPDARWSVNANGLLCWEGHIFVPEGQELCLRVLHTKHDHMLAGHFSQSKTLSLIRKDFFWPKLWEFVVDYVRSCNICTRNKTKQHRPYGFLKQLPISLQPWDSISMDFIKQLPPSENFTEILVVIDWLTKQAVFILTHRSIDVPGVADLFVRHIFSKHGVPSHVTSNRGSDLDH